MDFLADLVSRILCISVRELSGRYVKAPFPRVDRGLCRTKVFPVLLGISTRSMTIVAKCIRVLALSIQEHRDARRKMG